MDPVRGGANQLDARQGFENSVDLIGSTTLPGVFYGVVLSLYCLCVCSLYQSRSQKPHLRRYVIFSLIHSTVLVTGASVYLALLTRTSQISYINNKDYPGGPAAFKQDVLYSRPLYYMCITMSFILGVLTLVMPVSGALNFFRRDGLSHERVSLLDLAFMGNLEWYTVCAHDQDSFYSAFLRFHWYVVIACARVRFKLV